MKPVIGSAAARWPLNSDNRIVRGQKVTCCIWSSPESNGCEPLGNAPDRCPSRILTSVNLPDIPTPSYAEGHHHDSHVSHSDAARHLGPHPPPHFAGA